MRAYMQRRKIGRRTARRKEKTIVGNRTRIEKGDGDRERIVDANDLVVQKPAGFISPTPQRAKVIMSRRKPKNCRVREWRRRDQQAEWDWPFAGREVSLRVGIRGTNVWSFMVNSDGTIWRASVTWNWWAVNRRTAAATHDGGSGRAAFHYQSWWGFRLFDATGRLGGVIAKPSDKLRQRSPCGPGSVVALCLCQ